jgi:hypothetical protein
METGDIFLDDLEYRQFLESATGEGNSTFNEISGECGPGGCSSRVNDYSRGVVYPNQRTDAFVYHSHPDLLPPGGDPNACDCGLDRDKSYGMPMYIFTPTMIYRHGESGTLHAYPRCSPL